MGLPGIVWVKARDRRAEPMKSGAAGHRMGGSVRRARAAPDSMGPDPPLITRREGRFPLPLVLSLPPEGESQPRGPSSVQRWPAYMKAVSKCVPEADRKIAEPEARPVVRALLSPSRRRPHQQRGR